MVASTRERQDGPADTTQFSPELFSPSESSSSGVDHGVVRSMRLFVRLAAWLVMLIGGIGFLGWMIGSEPLKSVIPGHVSMKANTALCLVLAGLALRLLAVSGGRRWRVIGQTAAASVIVIGWLTLAEYAFDADLRIDQLLFHEPVGSVATLYPGRMAGTTAFSFVLLGCSMLLLDARSTRRRRIADTFSLFVGVTSSLAVFGHVFNVPSLQGLVFYTQMSLPGAASFLLLAAGMLFARPESGFMRVLASDRIGGVMLRQFLPLALLVPPLFAWLAALGEQAGLYGGDMDELVVALVLMCALTAIVFWNARVLDRTDAARSRAEDVLRSSRDQWELTFNCMSEGLSYHNPDYSIVGANESFYQLLGRDKLAGRKCYEVVHGTDCPPDYCPMRRTLLSGKTEVGEFYESRLGRHLSVRTDPVVDDSGQILRVVHVVSDITEQKRAEAAIRRLAAIVESTDDAVVGKDLEGHILSWNRAAERMYGYTAAEVVGKSIALIYPPELQHEMPATLAKIRAGKRIQSQETQRLRRDGTRIDISLTMSPILDPNGVIVGASSIARDITEKMRAEQEILRRSYEAQHARMRLNAVLASMAEGLYQLDENGDLVYLNAAAERMLGYRLDAVRGRNMHELIHSRLPDGTYRPAHECPLMGVLRGGQPFHAVEDYFQRGDGSFIPVEYTSSPLKTDGNTTGVVLSFRDITERKLAEEAERKARREIEAKSAEIAKLNAELEERVRQRTAELETSNRELEAFSYSVSHDLRAPLRSIDGFSHILLEEYSDKLDEEGRQFLNRVRGASQHMGQLIDALLQLSRVTRAEMRREQVNLSAMAYTIAENLRQPNPARSVDFRIPEGLQVTGDPRLLHVVMDNLLGNAFKFTSLREHAEIEFGSFLQDSSRVFFVRDNGAGFQMEYAHKLFGAFQRLHAVSEFDGSGIGLATVHRIIRRHGGRIWAEGIPDRGATFYFTLA